MTVTRAELRRELARRIGNSVVASTATGGSTTTLVDNVRLLDAGDSSYHYQGAWLLATSGNNKDAVRRVTSFAPATGTLTVGNAFANAVASGDSYELHLLLDPRDWTECVNRGLRRCTRLRREPLAIVAQQLQYSLAGLTWLEREAQIGTLLLRTGASGQKTEVEFAPTEWEIVREPTGLVLQLFVAQQPDPANSAELVLVAQGPYDPLVSDDQTTSCPLDWAVAAALVAAWEVYGWEIDQTDRARVNLDRQQAANEFSALTRRYVEPLARSIRLKGM